MADATQFKFGGVDTDVAVNHKHISVNGLDYIFVVQVAQINLRCGISPVTRIAEFKTHSLCKQPDFLVRHLFALDVRLLYNDLKISVACATKSQHIKACLREIGIVQTDAVECQDRQDLVIQAD